MPHGAGRAGAPAGDPAGAPGATISAAWPGSGVT